MTKKKILHLTKTYKPTSYGGIEKVIEIITENLSKNFFFEVVSLAPNKYEKNFNGIKLSYFKEMYSVLSTPFSFKIFQYLKKKNFEIVHFHYPWPFIDILVALLCKTKKKIVTYHADAISGIKIIDIIYLPFSIFFLYLMDKIIVTSHNYVKSSLILRLFKKKIEVIPIGIEIKKINFNEIHFDDFVLFLGVPRKYKGIKFIIDAAKKINCKIIISGFFKENFFSKYNLPSNVEIIPKPNENEKENLLKRCSAVILPSISRAEAFGISLLEAAQYYKPAITTELNTGTTFIIKDRINGYVISKKNSIELSKAINQIINDKKHSKEMGKNNRNRLETEFNYKKMLKAVKDLYDTM